MIDDYNSSEPASGWFALQELFHLVQERVAAKTSVRLDQLIDSHISTLLRSGEWNTKIFSPVFYVDDIAAAVLEQAGIDKEVL